MTDHVDVERLFEIIGSIGIEQRAIARNALYELTTREAKCAAAGQLVALEWVKTIITDAIRESGWIESQKVGTTSQEGNEAEQQNS
jgi:hypothetical protein